KAVMQFHFSIRSNVPALDGQTGGITAVAPPLESVNKPTAKHPNWWADNLAPEVAEGPHHGAKSVSQWRLEFLHDFAQRMARCAKAAPANP
ncbi:MAG: hypothetical protein IT423_18610, partial [Pirellulaceae bacterium]|nr:hypothetical protein [Pirellulaceae bacterium]